MKSLLLRIAIYGAGLLALTIAVLQRVDYRWQKKWVLNPEIIYDTDTTGDLYQMSLVNFFNVPAGPRFPRYDESDKQVAPAEAGLLVMGDSFLDHGREISLMELAGDALSLKVFYSAHYFTPLLMLDKNGCAKGDRRILLFELVERYLTLINPNPYKFQEKKAKGRSAASQAAGPLADTAERYWGPVRDVLFPENLEKKYEYFLKRCRWTYPATSALTTLQFRALGYISNLTPVYSLDPPMLFFYETVDDSSYSFFHRHTEEEVRQIADNLVQLQRNLREIYNLELVFMPVPNKMTTYHEYVTAEEYDGFLPRVYAELEKRAVPVVRLYEPFRAADSLLYHPADTHWNETGVKLATKECLEKLREVIASEGLGSPRKGQDVSSFGRP